VSVRHRYRVDSLFLRDLLFPGVGVMSYQVTPQFVRVSWVHFLPGGVVRVRLSRRGAVRFELHPWRLSTYHEVTPAWGTRIAWEQSVMALWGDVWAELAAGGLSVLSQAFEAWRSGDHANALR
jgi:hypothetical protein